VLIPFQPRSLSVSEPKAIELLQNYFAILKRDRQCMYNATQRRVRATSDASGKAISIT